MTSEKIGKVYIAGAGCGDYELMTVKLQRVLQEADCIIYDRLINMSMLNLAKQRTDLIYFGKENTEGGLIQEEINKEIVKQAKLGKTVLRLKGGHPFVFGRGGEEIQALVHENINFEVIPGITSAISAPAYAGIPISHRGINTSFHIFTGHTKKDGKWIDFEVVSKLDGTLVFLMGVKNLPKIVEGLMGNGKSPETPIALIENGTTIKQRVLTGQLYNIVEIVERENVVPPSIIIIGDVVNLREEMKWFEKMPLFGKKVLITRNKEQSKDFSDKIRKLGGDTSELPFIDIIYRDFEIPNLCRYNVLLFNSANAVRGFFDKIKDVRKLSGLLIGAVGVKTCEELEKNRIIPDFVPEEYLVDRLAEESMQFTDSNDRILILTSDISPVDIDEFNSKYDRNFDKLTVYETRKIKRDKEEVKTQLKEVTTLTFLSSSTVEAFMESIESDIELIKDKEIISIGPMTSKAIESYGLKIDIEAKKFTVDGIIDEMVKKL